MNYAPERAGIGPYTAAMAERLAHAGHEVRAIVTYPHYPEWSFGPEETGGRIKRMLNGVLVERVRHRLPQPGSSISRVFSEVSFGLKALLSRWRCPDVLVLVSPALFSSALVLLRSRMSGVPTVLWVQDLYGLGLKETRGAGRTAVLARAVEALERWTLRRADAVVVISQQMSTAVQALGVPADRTVMIRNWTHLDSGAIADPAVARRGLGWSSAETVVLHTGNMGVKQDLLNVVDAARLADERDAAVRFVLIGDGSARQELESVARGVRHLEIRLPVDEQQYREVLSAADVLLVNEHPGLRGMALPSKLTSYFTSGRPVLAATDSRSATAAEIVQSGAGVRVDPGDPRQLLEAAEQLGRDPGRRVEFGRAGMRYQTAALGEDVAVRRFGQLLSSLRQGGGTPRPARHGLLGRSLRWGPR